MGQFGVGKRMRDGTAGLYDNHGGRWLGEVGSKLDLVAWAGKLGIDKISLSLCVFVFVSLSLSLCPHNLCRFVPA